MVGIRRYGAGALAISTPTNTLISDLPIQETAFSGRLTHEDRSPGAVAVNHLTNQSCKLCACVFAKHVSRPADTGSCPTCPIG